MGYNLDHVRCEVQLRGEKAKAAFYRWCAGEDLGELARGLISGMVTFHDPRSSDSNVARRPIDPMWEKYLASVEKVKLTHSRGQPDLEKQLHALLDNVYSKMVEFGIDPVNKVIDAARAKYDGHQVLAMNEALNEIRKFRDYKEDVHYEQGLDTSFK
jgi:uncharacterized protein (UPF0297 family)